MQVPLTALTTRGNFSIQLRIFNNIIFKIHV